MNSRIQDVTKKCIFGTTKGKFLGHIVSIDGIEANPEKIRALINTNTPKTVKEVQSLNGKLAALGRFLAKSAERSILFFQTLKHQLGKDRIAWTIEAEEALQALKKNLQQLPTLASPIEGEPLIIYLSTNNEAVSSALLAERQKNTNPGILRQ